VVLILAAVLGTALFWRTGLDVALERWFYSPPRGRRAVAPGLARGRACYRAASWITASLALAGTGQLVLGLGRRGSRQMRLYGLFVLLSVALGPGLPVNLMFKEHWGRRRPGLSAASLGTGLALGTLSGLERMAAGGNFPSDVLWSGLIA